MSYIQHSCSFDDVAVQISRLALLKKGSNGLYNMLTVLNNSAVQISLDIVTFFWSFASFISCKTFGSAKNFECLTTRPVQKAWSDSLQLNGCVYLALVVRPEVCDASMFVDRILSIVIVFVLSLGLDRLTEREMWTLDIKYEIHVEKILHVSFSHGLR